jgi:hypothetical protein
MITEFVKYFNVPPNYISASPLKQSELIEDTFEIFSTRFNTLEMLEANSIKKISSNIKNVYFLKGTTFNRDEFRQLYPSLNITRLIGKADCFIYNPKDISIDKLVDKNTFVYKNSYYPFYFSSFINDLMCKRLYRSYSGYVEADKSPFEKDSEFNKLQHYNNHRVYTIGERGRIIQNYLANYSIPAISTSDLFNGAENEFRKEEITLEDLLNINDQINSIDKQIQAAAINILAMLDPSKYFPIQYFFYYLHYPKMSATAKGKILIDYIKNRKAQHIHSLNWTLSENLKIIDYILCGIKEKNYGPHINFKLIKEFFLNIAKNSLPSIGSSLSIDAISINIPDGFYD